MKVVSIIKKLFGGQRVDKDGNRDGILFASDFIEPSPAAREASERLGFMPRWHSFIEHGPHAGSWAMSVVFGTLGGNRNAGAIVVEQARIEMAGGKVISVDPRTEPAHIT